MTAKHEGPLEDAPFPEKLNARVVTPGANPRVHGYDVEGDLAAHYTSSETMLLCLTGELPEPGSVGDVRGGFGVSSRPCPSRMRRRTPRCSRVSVAP
jgi:hypothetical protein